MRRPFLCCARLSLWLSGSSASANATVRRDGCRVGGDDERSISKEEAGTPPKVDPALTSVCQGNPNMGSGHASLRIPTKRDT